MAEAIRAFIRNEKEHELQEGLDFDNYALRGFPQTTGIRVVMTRGIGDG
jgi:hypothetical protein